MRGSARAKTRREEPTPDGRPRCPTFLHRYAKALWRRLVPELSRCGILSAIDTEALAAYCTTFAEWRLCAEDLQKHGHYFERTKTYTNGTVKEPVVPNPEVRNYTNLTAALVKFQGEFGLTPSARTRIQVDHGKLEESVLDEFSKVSL